MKVHAAPMLLGLLSALAAATENQPRQQQTEHEELLGTWSVVRFERDGINLAPHGLAWKIDDQMITTLFDVSSAQSRVIASTPYRLLSGGKHPGIDIEPQHPPNKGTVVLGIYRLSGNTLTCCFQVIASDQRPTEFDAGHGSQRELIELKRR